jgi:hypothetical protein
MKRTLALALTLTLTLPLLSQVPIARGKTPPTSKVKGAHWYFDTVHHTAWTDIDLEWNDLGIVDVQEMSSAGHIIIIRSKLGYSLLSDFAEYLWAAPHVRVTDSLVLAWDSITTHIYTLAGGQYHPEHGFKAACWPIDGEPETVQSMPAYCLPDFLAANDSVECDSLHAYGMFGLHGHWLIAPQYERPFHFENGIAEVLLQGQRRKINDHGDLID